VYVCCTACNETDDGDYTETGRSCFNVNFNIFLSNSLVHQLVNKKKLIILRWTIRL